MLIAIQNIISIPKYVTSKGIYLRNKLILKEQAWSQLVRFTYVLVNQRSSSSIPISLAFPVSWVISFSNHIADITITSSSVMMTFPDPRGPDGILPSGPNLSEYPYSLSWMSRRTSKKGLIQVKERHIGGSEIKTKYISDKDQMYQGDWW